MPEQIVGHQNSFGFHGMEFSVVVAFDFIGEHVTYSFVISHVYISTDELKLLAL